jgi:hypothetical protein
MDKTTKAADAAEKVLHEVRAAHAASKPWSSERLKTTFAVMSAERAYCAALRAEKNPRVNCARCRRRFKPGEPMIWQWRYRSSSEQVCLRCHRSEYKSEHADRLAELDQQPCEACARTIYFGRYARRPLTCSFQCGYRRKLTRQLLERKRVEHATVACVACGEMFTQRRRDAATCSNRCRQALHRSRTAQREVAAGPETRTAARAESRRCGAE